MLCDITFAEWTHIKLIIMQNVTFTELHIYPDQSGQAVLHKGHD